MMKKILLGGIFSLLLCMSCTEQLLKEDFITDCEKSGFVKAEFEAKLKDAAFTENPQAILDFFYQKVKKTAHQNNELHPAWRIMERNQIF